MKLTADQIHKIAAKTSERNRAQERLRELRSEAKKPFQSAKVILAPMTGRAFVEEARINTELGQRLLQAMELHFMGVIERTERELADMGVEIEDAA